MSESLTEVEYLRRDNKRLRQQCSAEGKTKYAERLKDALTRAEQRALDACAEADTLRLNAERYEKLKAYLEELRSRGIGVLNLQRHAWDYDAAVDALEDVTK